MKKISAKILLTALLLGLALFATACGEDSPPSLGEDFLADAHSQVQEAYGDDYVPSMAIEEETLVESYGIPMDLVEDFIAEGPMMSTHIDTFIGLRTQPEETEAVAQAVRDYQAFLEENSMQYPMNMPKVEAAETLVVGDHVFFLMLGAFNEDPTGPEEELAFAKEQVQIGIDAIQDLASQNGF